tara:strand:- start:239 stop:1453 length:1215 start_codon:yes stop_codon:yes gene_type:complete
MSKVFIISYACCPNKQSEFAIGWNYVVNLSKNQDLTVLTRAKNKDLILKYINKSNKENLKKINWIFYDFNQSLLYLKKLIGTQLYFYFWQNLAYFKYRAFLNKEAFNYVHHLNYAVTWMSSPFHKIKGKFIWGPVGGGDSVPWSFLFKESFFNIFRESFYVLLNWFSDNISITNKLSRKKSSKILFRTKKVAARHNKNGDENKTAIICETGFDLNKIKHTEINFKDINAIIVGRMDYWKGIIYAVKGFEKYIKKGFEGKLVIIGDGKKYNDINKYIKKNNLENQIILKGKVSYTDYLNFVEKSNILIYPSFRDGGSFTVLESMAMGKVVICSNNSGPAEMVSDSAGFIIETVCPEQYINDICQNLINIKNNPERAKRKGQLARERAKEFYTWDKLSDKVQTYYC